MSIQPLVISPKDNPMQIDKTRFKPFKEQKKEYNEDPSHVVVNVQRSMIHIQFMQSSLPIHNQRS